MYISASEIPTEWQRWQISKLLEAAGDIPIISVTRKPLNLGTNLIDRDPRSLWNIYVQMLRAAKIATTPFVAMAEDDTLYTKEHFNEYRPHNDAVSYDRARWSLFVWEKNPIYCMRQRISNCSLIASRLYLIDALEERIDKHPIPPTKWVGEVGREKVDRALGVTIRNKEEWYCNNPIIQLNHINGSDDTQQKRWKKHGQMKAYDIPYWGKAKNIVEVYNGCA